mmetsp:Transcript_34486/g.62028  ORF Transcript_34486/g.62028 Transcript_34486/m.62028 type:complete len:685 (-) Transcript_34486:87-2141(-)
MARSSFLFLVAFFVTTTKYHVISSPSPSHSPPSASPSLLPSTSSSKTNLDGNEKSSVGVSSTTLKNEESPKKSNPSRPKSSSVTFLYELYEHEIYSPKTDSWTSRRFTQSPITGGGGRDSTSLNPQSCTPPRNYLFDGEWKIDMASESRDGFGWEYYVGKYDGLGRRRRRWVRTLRRVVSSVAAKKLIESKRKPTKSTLSKETKAYHPNLFQAIRNEYNFKGFGWAFYKSFIWARSVGALFRIPLSANFDFYDRCLAAPYITSATYFGYPWCVATFLSASLPLEAIKWLIHSIIWKIQWGFAVVSAVIRGVIEAAIWIVLWPWRLWRTSVQVMAVLASRFGSKQEEGMIEAVDEDATRSIIESSEGMNVTISTHIELNNSSEYRDNGNLSAVSATAVADSPRGGASNTTQVTSFRKKHLTMFGNEIPTFRCPNSIEYSSTIQERIGICVSWRVSQERGYEYRWNFVYSCLPTLLFWGQLEEERKRRVETARRYVGIWGKRNDPSSARHIGTIETDKIDGKDATGSESKSLSNSRSKSQSKPPILASFLSDHSSALGISGGWPMPVDPYFNLSLMLSLSRFYYGWLLKYIRSLFVLPSPKSLSKVSKDKELSGQNATISSADKVSSQKLVSSALKNKLPLEDAGDLGETDDEASITDSAPIDLLKSDSEDCLDNSTSTNLNVTGL